MKIAVASPTKYAQAWRDLRDAGHTIVSTWIDEAGEGQSASYADLANRCIEEVKSADVLLLYCENNDLLKGALIEAGAALASNIPVYCIGTSKSLSRVFNQHPLWISCSTMQDAMNLATFHFEDMQRRTQ